MVDAQWPRSSYDERSSALAAGSKTPGPRGQQASKLRIDRVEGKQRRRTVGIERVSKRWRTSRMHYSGRKNSKKKKEGRERESDGSSCWL